MNSSINQFGRLHICFLILINWFDGHVQFPFADIDEYMDSGFLALQRSIDKVYIDMTEQKHEEFKVSYRIHSHFMLSCET